MARNETNEVRQLQRTLYYKAKQDKEVKQSFSTVPDLSQ
jgi:hypothetical protein